METWILIAEYAKKYSISVSTVRRRIKHNELEYKKEHGRYYIKDSLANLKIESISVSETLNELVETQKALLKERENKIKDLEMKLKKKEEELVELQMLVDVLEEGKE